MKLLISIIVCILMAFGIKLELMEAWREAGFCDLLVILILLTERSYATKD